MFDFVDVDKEREKGLEDDAIALEHLDVTDWLKDEQLSCPYTSRVPTLCGTTMASIWASNCHLQMSHLIW